MKYLYGLTIQKIQSFIFETGKLKEIVGASQLVEDICTGRFKAFVGATYKEGNSIVTAAGKIMYIFDEQADCERVVLRYLRDLFHEIPGIKAVQAVVAFDGDLSQDDIALLERRQEIQKNKAVTSHGAGLMVSERARRTGGAGVEKEMEKGKVTKNRLDRKQVAKLKAEQDSNGSLLRHLLNDDVRFNAHDNSNISNLLSGWEKSWIAVVHADGNSLGRMIQTLSGRVEGDKLPTALRTFSEELDKATKGAAKKAFDKVIRPKLEGDNKKKQHIPIRPLILGGDDLTVIVRGDLALGFTEAYLTYFEAETQNRFAGLGLKYGLEAELQNGLTACAGIAYIKESYPLHYGIGLAESLCKHAKKVTKASGQPQSCLSFHRVMSSFSEDYQTIVNRELKMDGGYFDFGPYFIEKQPESGYESIGQLRRWAEIANDQNAPKAPIRNWLTELKGDSANAEQLMNRIKALNKNYVPKLGLDRAISIRDTAKTTHLFDVLTISNI